MTDKQNLVEMIKTVKIQMTNSLLKDKDFKPYEQNKTFVSLYEKFLDLDKAYIILDDLAKARGKIVEELYP